MEKYIEKMKRFLSLILVAVVLSSCQEDVKFNNPGFQGLKDDVLWIANDTRAYISPTGQLSVEAYTEYELITLNTASANVGTYVLGTTNTNNSATYSSTFNEVDLEYATIAVPGPVSQIALFNAGTGYSSGTSVATTGGTGSGLTVNVTANASGVVTALTLSSRGNAYTAGDLITVTGGNVNCTFRVLNVQNSNGEVKITEFDNENMTVSGKFKFNAANANNNPFGGPILNFQYGEFYKIPIYPSL
ncbi:DUF6252 family protein [Flavobacterium sp. UBA7682]|uniref:DUF6252 family protein n=1 Tax=Flavobacterium sp. UBA7682 TaxID=1946560 RepID=UPI0025C5EBF4|nr:DUF6252 family protein [Flavobacterium sp. UBA7682]